MSVTIGKPNREISSTHVYVSDYEMTRKEFRRAAAARERYRLTWSWRIAMKIVAVPLIIVCACGLVVLFQSESNEFIPMFMAMYGLFLCIGCILLFSQTMFVLINMHRKDVRKMLGEHIRTEVSANGVSSERFGTLDTIPWKAFKRSGVTRHGLILTLDSGVFHWLPAESFGNPSDWEAVRKMAEARLPKTE